MLLRVPVNLKYGPGEHFKGDVDINLQERILSNEETLKTMLTSLLTWQQDCYFVNNLTEQCPLKKVTNLKLFYNAFLHVVKVCNISNTHQSERKHAELISTTAFIRHNAWPLKAALALNAKRKR